jgi:hypothetical protein
MFASIASGSAELRAAWQLSTDDTFVSIGVAQNRPLIEQLKRPGSPQAWLGTPLPMPLMDRVWSEGVEVQTAWTFAGGVQDASSGTLTLRFTNSSPSLALRSVWRARPGHGPIEHWLELDNRSGRRVTVSQQDSLALTSLEPGPGTRIYWIKRGGSNASTQGGTYVESLSPELHLNLVSNCEDGSSPVPWAAVQVGESRGLYCGWEFSGLGRIEAKAKGDGKQLELRVGLLPGFKTDVEAGETFLVPPAFVGCYVGDMDDGSYTLHRWIIDKLRSPMPAGVPDPTLAYNLYLDAGGPKAREADVLRSAEFCRDLGFETFMPDAMWFPECGDWRWDDARFPNGVGPIEEFVHGHGMNMALWCAWSNGGISQAPGALSVRGPVGHPDWFNTDFAPDWKPGPFYGGRLCLGCPEARDWAISKTKWLVGQHHLDYLKHDIGPIVTQCNKTTHRHHYGVDTSYWAALGYYAVQEELRRAFPRLILENCSGGGHLKDYGAMARTHYVVTTDTLSNLPDRQSFYDSTFAFPPLVLQAYTYEREYHVPGDDPGPFLWRSAMMGAWQIDPTHTRIWTARERESARRAAAVYKSWIRPMLRDVKVHHVLPRPDGTNWDGLFYFSEPLQRGTLFIFRPDARDKEKTVKLKGLNPAQSYRVWSEDGSVNPAERSGAGWMTEGVTIQLPECYTSDLVYVQEIGKQNGAQFHGKPYTGDDLYSDTWVANDAAGRMVPGFGECGPPKPDKTVGIFYWTWHRPTGGGPNDNTRIIAAATDGKINWPSNDTPFHWGEPELGYYLSTDPFVIRKHASMLADAGVDVILFDTTNPPFTWKEQYEALCREYATMRREGVRTPAIAFIAPFGDPRPVTDQLWRDLYEPGRWKELWFKWEDKPFLLANKDFIKDKAQLEFFTFRRPMPDYWIGPTGPDQWSWLEVYPQHLFRNSRGEAEQMSVGVAQNALPHTPGPAPMSDRVGAMGRSWHDGRLDERPGAADLGLNFDEQWKHALQVNPRLIFVTGWNEWVAGRYAHWSKYTDADCYFPGGLFVDEYTREYSRDCEPMRGGHTDNYYYQLASWVRRYKGVRQRPLAKGPSRITIDGQFDDWSEVTPEFRDTIGDTLHRNHPGYGDLVYRNDTGRNDFVIAKAAYDDAHLYFFVQTLDPITPHTDPNWMLLFLDADQNPSTGWFGYDFVVNLEVSSDTRTTVKAWHGGRWQTVGEGTYRVNGNGLEWAIPRALVGQTNGLPAFDFHWADNILGLNDPAEFGINGDSAPNRRWNYRYEVAR